MNDDNERSPAAECLQSLHSIQSDYTRFKQENPVKRVFDPVSELYWTYYERSSARKANAGDGVPADLPCVVLLHGICGTAGCYFYILNQLAEAGVKCISAQYPEYYSPDEWIAGLLHFFAYLKLSKPVVFGSDLGGFLLQLFVARYPDSVCSMVLCNSYRRTDCFSMMPVLSGLYGRMYSLLPHVILRNIFVDSYICPQSGPSWASKVPVTEQLAREFMASELDHLTATDLGSRISLQLTSDYVFGCETRSIPRNRILIIETSNNSIPEELNEDMRTVYADAKFAVMKNGGDYPYLTRPEEITTFLLVHLTNLQIIQGGNSNSESVQRVVSCGNARDLHKDSVFRTSSDSSHCSVIPCQQPWGSNGSASPTFSDD